MNENLLDPKYIMLAGVVFLVIAVVAWLFVQERRSKTALRQEFGPGSKRKAEAKLANRQERVEKQHSRS